MTLMQLRYFCEVARTKNFTTAAKALFVAQSSVSAAIKDLEAELNLPLFTRRGNKGVDLTIFGEQFFPYAAKSLSILDEGLDILQNNHPNVVHIGCFVNTSHNLTPWFLKNFPNNEMISLDVQQTFVDLFAPLVRGEYDLIITSNSEPVENCASAKIAVQAVMLLVPTQSKYAFRERVTVTDIKDEQLRFVAPDSYMDLHIKQMFRRHGYTPNLTYSPDYSVLATDVALGKGIAPITRMPIDDKLLTFVPIDDPLALRDIYISWPTNRRLSDAAATVLQHVIDVSRASGPDSLVF